MQFRHFGILQHDIPYSTGHNISPSFLFWYEAGLYASLAVLGRLFLSSSAVAVIISVLIWRSKGRTTHQYRFVSSFCVGSYYALCCISSSLSSGCFWQFLYPGARFSDCLVYSYVVLSWKHACWLLGDWRYGLFPLCVRDVGITLSCSIASVIWWILSLSCVKLKPLGY